MLDPDAVDLDELAVALDDHSAEVSFGHSWWLDPRTGEIRFHSSEVDDESVDDLDEAGLVYIEPHPSSVGYGDMEDFIALVPDPRAQDRLARAIEGRGAFRRFKDVLAEDSELREEWFAFVGIRSRRHALEWLSDRHLVSDQATTAALARYPDPPVGGSTAALAGAVALDLRELYGDRLVAVLVFGSRARGDATEESDLDLLVVLDELDDPWGEHGRMDAILWRHTAASGIVVTAMPVSRTRFERPDIPVLIRARAEAMPA